MPTARNTGALWPWGRRAALLVSGVLLVVLVGGLAALRITAGWPDSRSEGAAMLAAVLLSLVPIGLLVLTAVAESRGAVSFRGLSISFGEVARAAATAPGSAGISVPRNVADEGVDVGDSGSSRVLSVLEDASRSDVVVVDLERGAAWWDTRLVLLCAGARLQGRPRAVVFVTTVAKARRHVVGWADPSDVVAQLVDSDPELRSAYATAMTSVRRAELVFPARRTPPGTAPVAAQPLPVYGVGAVPYPIVGEQELFDFDGEYWLPQTAAKAFTRAFGRALRPIEESRRARQLSAARVQDLLMPVLHTRSTDLGASDAEWTDAVLALDTDYVAVTDQGVFRGLAERERLVRALLRSLVNALSTP